MINEYKFKYLLYELNKLYEDHWSTHSNFNYNKFNSKLDWQIFYEFRIKLNLSHFPMHEQTLYKGLVDEN